MKNGYEQITVTNVRPLGVNHRIEKYASTEKAFTELLLPHYRGIETLRTGRPLPVINLRPREILGLCLMSYLAGHIAGGKWTIATDPFTHDGTVTKEDEEPELPNIKRGLIIEQFYIANNGKTSLLEAFKDNLEKKSSRGADYARNVNLVVLSEVGAKEEFVDLARLVEPSIFEACYLFIMKDPLPYRFESVVLKSPADPLEYCAIGLNVLDGTARIQPLGLMERKIKQQERAKTP